jgi:exosortase
VAAAFALGIGWYAWAVHVRAADLQAVSLIFNVSGLVMLRWGVSGLRTMWLPIAFLVFCIPIPSPLLVTVLWELRLWTAEYTGWLLYLLGIPALVSGDQILRAAESFQVIEGCSGLRSTETLTMLVVLLVDLFHRRGWHAVLLLVSAPPVAFALNGVRVLTLTLNPHSEVVAIHSLQGVAILLVGLLVVYAFDGLLARILPSRRLPTASTGAEVSTSGSLASLGRATVGGILAASLCTAAAALWVPVWSGPRPPRDLVAAVDEALATWEYTDLGPDAYFEGRTYFREKVRRSYSTRGPSVEVFVGSANLSDRRTSIVSRITEMPGSGWMIRESKTVRLEPGGDEVHQLVVEKGTVKRLVIHRLVGVEGLVGETLRSFLGLDRSGFQRTTRQIAVRLSTSVNPAFAGGRERAEERLERLYEQLAPALEEPHAVAPTP